MAITQRQFNHLNEIGITVWQRRNTSNTNSPSNNASSSSLPLAIHYNELIKLTLFTDILQCIGISIGEVNIENNVIDLGLFNWQFSENDLITFDNNILSTPAITAFETSTKLKKDLWRTIQQKVLA